MSTAAPLTPAWTQLRPHAEQARLWLCPKRFCLVPAGRGSGKTVLAQRRLVRCLPIMGRRDIYGNPIHDPRYFLAGPTYSQVRRNSWVPVLALIPPQWILSINQSDMVIRTVLGSELHLLGMDQPQRIEGNQWDGGVLDESCDLRPGTFDRNVLPALTWRNGWCWRIGVPKRTGPSASEYRAAFERARAGSDPEAAGFTWPSSDILPDEALRHARETLDPKDYREQFEASFETVGGAIYHAFSRIANVRPCEYHPEKPLVIGCDFNAGSDPMAWVIGHRYPPDRLEWFDEIWQKETNTQEALDILWGRYQHHRGGFEFYGDASSHQRHSSASFSDYQIIWDDRRFAAADTGRVIHFPESNPALPDRYASTNAMLCNAAGNRRMHIDPRCRRLIEDLENVAYKPGTREPDKSNKDRTHITDALGYAVWKLYPICLDRPYKPEPLIVRGRVA